MVCTAADQAVYSMDWGTVCCLIIFYWIVRKPNKRINSKNIHNISVSLLCLLSIKMKSVCVCVCVCVWMLNVLQHKDITEKIMQSAKALHKHNSFMKERSDTKPFELHKPLVQVLNHHAAGKWLSLPSSLLFLGQVSVVPACSRAVTFKHIEKREISIQRDLQLEWQCFKMSFYITH